MTDLDNTLKSYLKTDHDIRKLGTFMRRSTVLH